MHVVLSSISIWTLYALVSCVSVSCLSMAKKVRWELVYDPMPPNDEPFDRFAAADHRATAKRIQQRDDELQRQRDDEQQQQEQQQQQRQQQRDEQRWQWDEQRRRWDDEQRRQRDDEQRRQRDERRQQQKRVGSEWSHNKQRRNENAGHNVTVAAPAMCNCTETTEPRFLSDNHYPPELMEVTCTGSIWCSEHNYTVWVLLRTDPQEVANKARLPNELLNVSNWGFDVINVTVACFCSIRTI